MKDPAFLFYPNDWLGGTMGMTFEEKGAYIDLLMMQFNRGHMTSHMIGQQVGQLWDKLKDKFIKDDNGLYYNERLEIEINRRKTYTSSRKNNLLGTNQYSKKRGHMTSHMENRDINEIVNSNKRGVGKKEIEVVLPWQSDQFKNMWEQWKRYKSKEFQFNYKSEQSQQSALMQLASLAEGDETKAIAIIKNSMANGWKGFFETKKTKLNGNTSNLQDWKQRGADIEKQLDKMFAAR